MKESYLKRQEYLIAKAKEWYRKNVNENPRECKHRTEEERKEYNRKKQLEYYEKHKEKVKAKRRERYLENREKELQKCKERYAKKKEENEKCKKNIQN